MLGPRVRTKVCAYGSARFIGHALDARKIKPHPKNCGDRQNLRLAHAQGIGAFQAIQIKRGEVNTMIWQVRQQLD